MQKEKLINNILEYLNNELSAIQQAAKNAHLAAIDEQSIAETQYDTLAIEAGYLAEGQSRRVHEIQLAIEAFEQLKFTNPVDKVVLSSLVLLSQDEDNQRWFFLGPAAAGYSIKMKQKKITVVTPLSPLGQALLGSYVGDEITFHIGNRQLTDHIVAIR